MSVKDYKSSKNLQLLKTMHKLVEKKIFFSLFHFYKLQGLYLLLFVNPKEIRLRPNLKSLANAHPCVFLFEKQNNNKPQK